MTIKNNIRGLIRTLEEALHHEEMHNRSRNYMYDCASYITIRLKELEDNIKREIDALIQTVDEGYEKLSGKEIHFLVWACIEEILLGVSDRLKELRKYSEKHREGE